jgi:hypothetical protein
MYSYICARVDAHVLQTLVDRHTLLLFHFFVLSHAYRYFFFFFFSSIFVDLTVCAIIFHLSRFSSAIFCQNRACGQKNERCCYSLFFGMNGTTTSLPVLTSIAAFKTTKKTRIKEGCRLYQ